MTEEYAEVYAEAMRTFAARGLDANNSSHVKDFAQITFDTPDDIARFKTRASVHKEFGANAQYTGDGTTKNLLSDSGKCGVMEVFNVDKRPGMLGDLEHNKAAKRLTCKRI